MTVWTVPARIVRVVDGHTVEAHLDLGWHITYHTKIRLAGINCPEMSTPAGPAARAYTVNWLNALMPVGDGGPLNAEVKVVSHTLDKYGRVLGEILRQPLNTPPGVTLPIGGWESLGASLLPAGHAMVMK